MPIIKVRYCAQWFKTFTVAGSKPGVKYSVSFAQDLGPRCTCPAFEHAVGEVKTCKHIQRVMKHACLWNERWYAGGDKSLTPDENSLRVAPTMNDMCPHCGGRIVTVRRIKL